ncbi:hypothetical protein [Streptomyces sp. NBC_01180]|uniref:hypothetical protein n=1 Tax=Streptomyces sp. NBC_01180 TaxID=2903763 RepID=UPI00386B08F5|nr:hypothetical protein OG708_34340 [Streptomyces sp. NBC_01180]
MASARDPERFDLLSAQAASDKVPPAVLRIARHRISVVLARNGGSISEITVGDRVDILQAQDLTHATTCDRTAFYRLRHRAGVLPPDAPSTIRACTGGQGQLSVAEMIDRYEIACKPVRELLVDHLRERQPAWTTRRSRPSPGLGEPPGHRLSSPATGGCLRLEDAAPDEDDDNPKA